MEDAANSCSIACPSGQDDECGGDLKCWGNTECMNRASFFCGTSWLDASDRCHKPCPTGDSFLECDAGEACFAWTSCDNTDSFYCGVSFEDASANCAVECPSRSSVVDCPNGQGCFAYTTCEATKDVEHETDPLHVPMNDYFCGESAELAASTCSIACQGGQDSECPDGMQCHDDTGCSTRDSFWCGSSWRDAAETCGTPCTSGSPEQCPGDERCYAHTGCQANMFFCGETFEEAEASCGGTCETRSSDQCDDGQYCFAFVTACAAESSVQSYASGIANTQWDFGGVAEHDLPGSGGSGTQPPEWYTKWESEMNSSSSVAAGYISCVLAAIATVALAMMM